MRFCDLEVLDLDGLWIKMRLSSVCKWDLRQGNPLFSLLFMLMADGLNRIFKRAKATNSIQDLVGSKSIASLTYNMMMTYLSYDAE